MDILIRLIIALATTLLVLAIIAIFLGFFVIPFILVFLMFTKYSMLAAIGLGIWTLFTLVFYYISRR